MPQAPGPRLAAHTYHCRSFIFLTVGSPAPAGEELDAQRGSDGAEVKAGMEAQIFPPRSEARPWWTRL